MVILNLLTVLVSASWTHSVFSLRQLQHFIAAADAGTVTAAADQVHISQAAMSQSLNELARSVGRQLMVEGRFDAVFPPHRALIVDVASVESHGQQAWSGVKLKDPIVLIRATYENDDASLNLGKKSLKQ